MKEEDIEIVYGDVHSSPNIENLINEKKDLIFEICKIYPDAYFVLDIERLKVVEEEDFVATLPTHGLNSIFMFTGMVSKIYNCLVNTSKEISSKDVFTWFISYIYSTRACLAPIYKTSSKTLQFFHALTGLIVSKGNKKYTYTPSNEEILSAPMSDTGMFVIQTPGVSSRYVSLLKKSRLALSTGE